MVACVVNVMALADKKTTTTKTEYKFVQDEYITERIYLKRWCWRQRIAVTSVNSQHAKCKQKAHSAKNKIPNNQKYQTYTKY